MTAHKSSVAPTATKPTTTDSHSQTNEKHKTYQREQQRLLSSSSFDWKKKTINTLAHNKTFKLVHLKSNSNSSPSFCGSLVSLIMKIFCKLKGHQQQAQESAAYMFVSSLYNPIIVVRRGAFFLFFLSRTKKNSSTMTLRFNKKKACASVVADESHFVFCAGGRCH